MKREDNQRIRLVEQFVEAKRDDFIDLADRIWDLAETRWEEFRSVEAQIELLEREGFRITRNLGGLPTAHQHGVALGVHVEDDAGVL